MVILTKLTLTQVRQVKMQGKYANTAHLEIWSHSLPTQGTLKFLILAPKKNLPFATQRNRARRIITEAIRIIFDTHPQSIDLVIRVKHPLEGLKTQDIHKELAVLFI